MSDRAFLQGSADLLLKLYESRREPALREARDWWVTKFHPKSAKDVLRIWVSAESAPYRMVTTHWEMAATFVALGAIDAAMFHAANTEHLAIYARLRPYLAEIRELTGYPTYLAQLEKVVTDLPDLEERLAPIQRYLARRAAEAQQA
ncbi:MAG: hypothetical protein HOP28_16610 [Gemmatimonadales bacterium]|nr:hypothetical protein [Gemmatimonadales bacterium]